jgi:hypothetical protein
MYYRLYEMTISSDIEFPQLVLDGSGSPADVEITSGEIPTEVLEEYENTKKKYIFGSQTSWLSNKTCWLVVENGDRITYSLKEGGNPEYLKSYILGFGMSMLAMQRDNLAIHCSALADENGALLIAGESGAGKSTLTTAFLNNGYHLLADDMALVEIVQDDTCHDKRAIAKPAFPYQKLCRNVAIEQGYNLDDLLYINEEKDKFLVPYKGDFSTKAIPVKGFIMLDVTDKDDIDSCEIKGLDKFYVCTGNLFLRHLLNRDRYNPHIGQKCLEMASAVPIYKISRPGVRDTVNEVISKAFEITEEMDRQLVG